MKDSYTNLVSYIIIPFVCALLYFHSGGYIAINFLTGMIIFVYALMLALSMIIVLAWVFLRFLYYNYGEKLDNTTKDMVEKTEAIMFRIRYKSLFRRVFLLICSLGIMYFSLKSGFVVLFFLEAITESYNIADYLRYRDLSKDETFLRHILKYETPPK
jgi:hypothetical protein